MAEKEQKTPKKDSFLKKIVNNNPYDKFFNWQYNLVEKLGIKNVFDTHWYYTGGWNSFRTIFKLLWGYNTMGSENFPEYGPGIVISNHQSELDPFLTGTSVQRIIHWVSKVENFDIPIFKSLITPFGTIPLRRGESDKEAVKMIQSTLDAGKWIGLFPEGTRSPDGKLSPFHKGAAKFAMQFNVPYVPFCLMGAHKILPKHMTWYKMKLDNKIEVRVGKPVFIDPDVEITLESLEFVRDQMYNDVLTLQKGEMNDSRTIRQSDIDRGSMAMKTEILPYSSTQIQKKRELQKSMNTAFNPLDEFSIA